MIDMDELRKKAEAATGGNWVHDDSSVSTDLIGYGNGTSGWRSPGKSICHLNDGEYIENPNSENDASFITSANPSVVLELIDRIEKAEAARNRLRTYAIERHVEIDRLRTLLARAGEALKPFSEEATRRHRWIDGAPEWPIGVSNLVNRDLVVARTVAREIEETMK